MKIAVTILITVLFLWLQDYLSKRENFIWGLIIPAVIAVGCVWMLTCMVKPGTRGGWTYKHALLLVISLGVYFDGREKVKGRKKKELEKMAIRDLQ